MTGQEKKNIYNAIQNLYNMDFTTWQEVLAMLYNLVADVEQKFEKLEAKFTLMLGKEVTEALKKMYNDGSLGELINDVLLQDINNKVDEFENDFRETLTNYMNSNDTKIKTISNTLNAKADYKKVYQQARINVSNRVYSNAIATFIVDDGTEGFLSLVKPVFDSNNIKGSIAIISEKVGTNNYMNLSQLKTLQEEGYSMLCHSATHDELIYKPGVATANDSKITADYKKAYEFMIKNGFNGADTIVYPWGNFENSGRYKNLARDYYNNGINASGTYNLDLNDNMYLNRTFINKNKPLQEYRNIIDECISDKGWIIFGIHANTNEIDTTHLTAIISYLKEKGVKILPFLEANEIKGNAINVGDYTMNEKFFVSRTGKVAMAQTVPTSYEIEQGENYNILFQNVKKVGNIVIGNIKLENSSQTGTFTNSQVLCTIKNLRVPAQLIVNGVITAGGAVYNGGIVIENTGATDLSIKCHGNMSELNNIRWININFSYII